MREIRTAEKIYSYEEEMKKKAYLNIQPEKKLTKEELNMEIAAVFAQAAKKEEL